MSLNTEVSSFQGVGIHCILVSSFQGGGIKGFKCIQRCQGVGIKGFNSDAFGQVCQQVKNFLGRLFP